MKKTKILFVISNINIGGPQKSLLALLDRIDYNLFDVSVLVMYPEGDLKSFYNKEVKFIEPPRIVTAATIPSRNTKEYLKVFLKEKRFDMFLGALKAIFNNVALKKIMNQERQKFWKKFGRTIPKLENTFDMAFGILGLSTYYIVDCVESEKKYHWIRSDTRILNRDIEIDSLYYSKLDGSLSVSKECGDIFVHIYPFMKDRVKVFHNYIPVSFYNKLDYDRKLIGSYQGYYKIISVMRLDPLKGIEMAIEACSILISKGYRIKWFVLGDGKHRSEVEKIIKANNLQESFILLGFQLNTLSLINEADIFVHPSRTEGKSNAVDEAKYAGKPIVVTNYETVGDQITDGVNGLICDMNGEAVAKSVERLILDETLRSKLSDACRGYEDGIKDISGFLNSLTSVY